MCHVVSQVRVAAALVGSAFNIWYNVSQIHPLLTDGQWALFKRIVTIYNSTAYPVLIAVWLARVVSLRQSFNELLAGNGFDESRLAIARVRAINLPWFVSAVMGLGWVLCIPALMLGMQQSSEPVDSRVLFHLPTSIVIAALITITHSFFIVELLVGRLLFPVLFQDGSPAETLGTISLPLHRRNLLCAVAICVCPILSLVLLEFVDAGSPTEMNWFMVYVGSVGIGLGLFCSWMVSRHVVDPIETLRAAAGEVARGNLDVRIDLRRADEFGPLIDEFNHMVDEMRSKRELNRRFRLHVGRRTAKLILAQDPGLTGAEQDITVMFFDIRNFTERCSMTASDEIVPLLNRFLTMMVDVVENQHDGNVNKFLGDGFMALFGIGEDLADDRKEPNHARDAVNAGLDMIGRLDEINTELEGEEVSELGIGIGIHSGVAVVGSMGSQDRLEYTAIGDTVNIASRVEGLTKRVGHPLLVTSAIRDRLHDSYEFTALEPERVKGQQQPIEIFTVERRSQGR